MKFGYITAILVIAVFLAVAGCDRGGPAGPAGGGGDSDARDHIHGEYMASCDFEVYDTDTGDFLRMEPRDLTLHIKVGEQGGYIAALDAGPDGFSLEGSRSGDRLVFQSIGNNKAIEELVLNIDGQSLVPESLSWLGRGRREFRCEQDIAFTKATETGRSAKPAKKRGMDKEQAAPAVQERRAQKHSFGDTGQKGESAATAGSKYTTDDLCKRLLKEMGAMGAVSDDFFGDASQQCGALMGAFEGDGDAMDEFVGHVLNACDSYSGMQWMECLSTQGQAAESRY